MIRQLSVRATCHATGHIPALFSIVSSFSFWGPGSGPRLASPTARKAPEICLFVSASLEYRGPDLLGAEGPATGAVSLRGSGGGAGGGTGGGSPGTYLCPGSG